MLPRRKPPLQALIHCVQLIQRSLGGLVTRKSVDTFVNSQQKNSLLELFLMHSVPRKGDSASFNGIRNEVEARRRSWSSLLFLWKSQEKNVRETGRNVGFDAHGHYIFRIVCPVAASRTSYPCDSMALRRRSDSPKSFLARAAARALIRS